MSLRSLCSVRGAWFLNITILIIVTLPRKENVFVSHFFSLLKVYVSKRNVRTAHGFHWNLIGHSSVEFWGLQCYMDAHRRRVEPCELERLGSSWMSTLTTPSDLCSTDPGRVKHVKQRKVWNGMKTCRKFASTGADGTPLETLGIVMENLFCSSSVAMSVFVWQKQWCLSVMSRMSRQRLFGKVG